MFYISRGEPPFKADQPIDIDENFNLWVSLQAYKDSNTFPEMVNFLE